MQFLPWACARATFQEALTYSRSKMRAARSDRGCAAPNRVTTVRHDVVAISAGRHDAGVEAHGAATMRSPTAAWRNDASAGCPTVLTMVADREGSRGPRRFKSQPRYYPMGRAPEPARRFSCLRPCQTAMTIALFRSCRGPSAALFTVRRI